MQGPPLCPSHPETHARLCYQGEVSEHKLRLYIIVIKTSRLYLTPACASVCSRRPELGGGSRLRLRQVSPGRTGWWAGGHPGQVTQPLTLKLEGFILGPECLQRATC